MNVSHSSGDVILYLISGRYLSYPYPLLCLVEIQRDKDPVPIFNVSHIHCELYLHHYMNYINYISQWNLFVQIRSFIYLFIPQMLIEHL